MGNRPLTIRLRWLPVLLWMGMIFALSSISGLRSGLVEGLDLALRKLAHATEFGILSALMLRALVPEPGAIRRREYAFAALLAVLYAASDELHQRFIDERTGAWTDVLIDFVGVLVGLDLRRRYLRRMNTTRISSKGGSASGGKSSPTWKIL